MQTSIISPAAPVSCNFARCLSPCPGIRYGEAGGYGAACHFDFWLCKYLRLHVLVRPAGPAPRLAGDSLGR